MSRFLFNLVLAAGLSCSAAAFAQSTTPMSGGMSSNAMSSNAMGSNAMTTPAMTKPDHAMKHDTAMKPDAMSAGSMSHNTMSSGSMSHDAMTPNSMGSDTNK